MSRGLPLLLAIVVVTATSDAAQGPTDDGVRALLAEGDRYAAESVRRFDIALDRFREADRRAEGSSDLRLRATARQKIAQMLFDTDHLLEAVSAGREAFDLATKGNAFDLAGSSLRTVGGALIQLARFEEAETTLKAAAEIAAKYGTSDQLSRSLSNLSANARIQGKLGDAIGYGRQAIAVVDQALARGETLSPRALFAVPFNLGKSMADSGDYMDSRAFLDRAFASAEQFKDIGGQMHVLFDTGEWYEVQGDFDRAERYYERAAAFGRSQLAGEEAEGKALRGLGRIAFASGRHLQAVQFLTDSVRVFESTELRGPVPATLVDLARARAAAGDPDGAARDLERAIGMATQRDQPAARVAALIERGRQHVAAHRLDSSRVDFNAAILEADRARLLPLVPAAWAGRAAAAEAAGDLSGALDAYQRAADALDRIRGRIVSIDLRTNFSAASHDTFTGMVRVLMALHAARPGDGFAERALMALERERSQSLDLAVNEARATGVAKASGLDSGGRIAHIQNALFAPDLANQRRQSLLHALDDAERDLAMDAGAHHGESDGPARRVRRVSSIADLRAALGPNDTVVEYAIIDDAATAFIVSGDRLTIVPITTPVDLTDRVSFFVRALEDNARDASIASGRALAERLLDPVLPLLPEGGRVLIVAAGALARLPFAALPVVDAAGRPVPLMTRNEVTYLPSLTLFARRRAAGSGALDASVLAVADAVTPEAHSRGLAPLPASRIEAERAASYGSRSQLLAGAGATEQAVKLAASNKYSVVHLATHALLDPVVPERSAVLLGASGDDDGLLQSREIYELPLNGSLIVLSGCRTADGQISGAEGLRSLSRAFLQAGGRAVVGALWDLPDAGAERIVTVFYQTLEDGASAGAALRQAQLSAAGSDPYAVTRTWASMVILGDSSLQINTKGRRPTFTIAAAGFALILITSLAWRRRVRRESRGLYRR